MSNQPSLLDPIGAAITSAERRAPVVTLSVALSTGRNVGLIVPVDLSRQEALDLVGSIARELPNGIALAAAEQLGPVLEVPGGLHAVPKA